MGKKNKWRGRDGLTSEKKENKEGTLSALMPPFLPLPSVHRFQGKTARSGRLTGGKGEERKEDLLLLLHSCARLLQKKEKEAAGGTGPQRERRNPTPIFTRKELRGKGGEVRPGLFGLGRKRKELARMTAYHLFYTPYWRVVARKKEEKGKGGEERKRWHGPPCFSSLSPHRARCKKKKEKRGSLNECRF